MNESPTSNSFKFTAPPKPAGAYWVGGIESGFGFHVLRRPRWFHRWMTRLLLGWVWEDTP